MPSVQIRPLSSAFSLIRLLSIFITLLAQASLSFAATPNISIANVTGQAGSTITIPVHFTAGDTKVSATQFNILLPPGFTFTSASAGAAASAADKNVISSELPNSVQLFVLGFTNANPIGSGVLANLTVQVASGTPDGNYPIGITGVVSSDPNGTEAATSAEGGMATIGNPVQNYPLSGTVTINGNPLANVRIDSEELGVQFTGANGSFSYRDVPANVVFKLTPSLAGYTFSPAAYQGSVTGPSTVNFSAAPVALPTFTLSGSVKNGSQGVSGVTINGGPLGNRSTDSSGAFSFNGVQQGTVYTLTPSRSGYAFSPTSRSGTLVGNESVSFSAFPNQLPKFTLSGTVTASGNALSGVTVNGGALGNRTTGSNGQFTFANVQQGTQFSLTPSKSGYTFSPAQASGVVENNVTLSFLGTPQSCTGPQCPGATFSVSGRVTYNGSPLAGASVRVGRTFATTQADGSFVATGLPKGRYAVTPSFPGMRFSPRSTRIVLSTQNAGGMNFNGVCSRPYQVAINGRCSYPKFSVTGRVMLAGAPVKGVAVKIGSGKTTTDANGSYQLSNIGAGQYFPRAVLSRYTISPNSGRTLSLTGNTSLDFTAVCWRGYTPSNGQCVRNR